MSENAKPTPGPWRECGHDRGGCQCGQVWSVTADCPVATVESGEWGDAYPKVREVDGKPEAYMEHLFYGSIPEGDARANARLIAAAPDLLEAAKKIMTVTPGTDAQWAAILDLKAAIAKAEGSDD